MTVNENNGGHVLGRVATIVQGAKDLDTSAFRKRLGLFGVPFAVGVAANSAVSASSLSRTSRAVVSAPFSLMATFFGLALGMGVLGRYVRVGVRGYRIVAAVSAFLLGFIMVTGAAVRLTGSGLGCPDWPTCKDGDVIPQSGRAAQIEFGNRVVTGLCILAAALGVLLALVRVPYRRDLVKHGVIISVLIFGNAIVGGVVVLLHLKSGVVAAHFLLAVASLTAGLVLFHRAGEPGASAGLFGRDRRAAVAGPLPMATRAATGLLLLGVVIGTVVSGSGPHSGDPAKTERFPFDLERVAQVHSGVMWLALAAVVVTAVLASKTVGAHVILRRLTWLMAALVAQGGIGYWQWAKQLPSGLVQLHIVGAIVCWATLLWVRAAVWVPAAASTVLEGTRELVRTGAPGATR